MFHLIILILHVLGASLVVGVVFFSLVFSLTPPLNKNKLELIKRVRQFGLYGMGLVTITGLLLIQQDTALIRNKWLLIKLCLIVVDYLVAVRLINAKINSALSKNETLTDLSLQRLTWFSALIFLVIVSIGVFLVEST